MPATLPGCSFWKKRVSQEDLLVTAAKVQSDAWRAQLDAGIQLVGLDGTLYDQVRSWKDRTFFSCFQRTSGCLNRNVS